MYPSIGPVPTHELFVGLGVVAAILVFVVEARRRGQTDEKVVWVYKLRGGQVVSAENFLDTATMLKALEPPSS